MAVAPGAQLGPYQIGALIGVGGMGEVYRATDTHLKRQVAIKVLPAPVSDDRERIARFQREAEVLAALNHQNIGQIYGLEKSERVIALVMELVEGPTLADRIAQGRMSIEEALAVAEKIAEALEAAHEQRIIHRDLKPGNVKVRSDGTVKVLDFGLAKAISVDAESRDLTQAPTLTAAGTRGGIILGTAAYMSPEQAKGLAVDRRTDLFAFGAVLYEMLTGKPAFAGETVGDILAAVIRAEPNWTALPSETPSGVRRLLRRCLQKDRRERLDSAAAARMEIAELAVEPDRQSTGPSRPGPKEGTVPRMLVPFLSILAAALMVPAVLYFREPPPDVPEVRLEISTPSTPLPLHFALSPNGRLLVFVAAGDGPSRLWLRTLDKTEAIPMSGTEGAEYPFWSADSRSIGFFATGKLYRIEIDGGPPQQVAIAASGTGGAWNADGTILYTPDVASDRLYRIPATGGERVAVTETDPSRTGVAHHFPIFLPDQRRFLFYATGNAEVRGIYLGSLEGGSPKRLMATDSYGTFFPPDRIAFIRDGTLVTRQIDLVRGELVGEPVTLAEGLGYDSTTGWGGFSVSGAGNVAYRQGLPRRQLVWYDRSGKMAGRVGNPDASDLAGPAISPDGRRVAVARNIGKGNDIWLFDLLRGDLSPFTFEPETEVHAVWSSDGSSVAYESNRQGWKMRAKPSSGTGTGDVLLDEPDLQRPQDWSKDGRFLVYDKLTTSTGHDVWVVDLSADRRSSKAVVATSAEELNAQFSPDGRWLAYETNESGRYQVVAQSFPTQTRTWPISINGGVQPRWSADGKELYFIAPDRRLMAATINTSGSTLEASMPVALFPTHIVSSRLLGLHAQYAVSRSGQFLINETADELTTPITLILNWRVETD